MKRVGLFGGSFDPVHNAHVALATTALAQLASGGIDNRIDSVRPPDWRPKCVPRSQTRLNST